MWWKTVCVLLVAPSVLGVTELLHNSDFELKEFRPEDGGWYGNGCTADWSSDSYAGKHSVKVTNRVRKWGGMAYNVTLSGSKNYYFKAEIKLLNTHPGSLFTKVQVRTAVYSTSGSVKHALVSEVRFMEPLMWQVIGGDFSTPADVTTVQLYVQITDTDVNYLLDTSTLHEIPTIPNSWRAEADIAIEKYRKADLNIRALGSLPALKDLTVEVNQEKHEFGFGSAVHADMLVDSQYKAYQDFFYDNFEWGVIENKLKWKQMEWSEGHVDYDTALNAIDAMLKHGVKIRAHNVFWGIDENIPKWQQGMTGQTLWKQMERRIQGVIPRTKGKVEHWDVNNENVHGHFYEIGTGDANATMWMFREIHKLDPNVKLFLNDFGVVKDSHSTQAFYDQAMMFKNTPNVPLYGLGIQSHLFPPIDMSVLKYRLDQIVSTGLPIWITELDISEPLEDRKADLYEDVLRLYFSTPQIHGIMFWGFWDGKHSKPVAAIASGQSVTPNAAGQRWQKLFKHDWRTVDQARSLSTGQATIRGFKGRYSLSVKRNGVTLHNEEVILGTGGTNLTLSLAGIGDTIHVSNILIG
ncbi:anti-sigma-I factor RsgI6-like isoform X1 [Haliotis rufescens]|uniref:anti-sigma-I factor RsgI6-like isoform X1 n=1 Tax=Haliotis rufescens TaxID=6454 RepID=UPI00201E805E|nr:anti-sigma-I factor RsgI6-like isoform X1 [Haliotis rufescens]